MKRYLITVIAFLLTNFLFSQKKNVFLIPPGGPTKSGVELEEKNHNCIRKLNNSFSKRLQNYPFNKASQIQLVAFTDTSYMVNNEMIYIIDSLPRQNDTVCYSRLRKSGCLPLIR